MVPIVYKYPIIIATTTTTTKSNNDHSNTQSEQQYKAPRDAPQDHIIKIAKGNQLYLLRA